MQTSVLGAQYVNDVFAWSNPRLARWHLPLTGSGGPISFPPAGRSPAFFPTSIKPAAVPRLVLSVPASLAQPMRGQYGEAVWGNRPSRVSWAAATVNYKNSPHGYSCTRWEIGMMGFTSKIPPMPQEEDGKEEEVQRSERPDIGVCDDTDISSFSIVKSAASHRN